MSTNDHLRLAPPKKKMDARVQRTRDALGDALIELMQEKPFDTITVQDVLDRAHVSRSTFYTHYSDKDDLLMSDAEEFFEALSMAVASVADYKVCPRLDAPATPERVLMAVERMKRV